MAQTGSDPSISSHIGISQKTLTHFLGRYRGERFQPTKKTATTRTAPALGDPAIDGCPFIPSGFRSVLFDIENNKFGAENWFYHGQHQIHPVLKNWHLNAFEGWNADSLQ